MLHSQSVSICSAYTLIPLSFCAIVPELPAVDSFREVWSFLHIFYPHLFILYDFVGSCTIEELFFKVYIFEPQVNKTQSLGLRPWTYPDRTTQLALLFPRCRPLCQDLTITIQIPTRSFPYSKAFQEQAFPEWEQTVRSLRGHVWQKSVSA